MNKEEYIACVCQGDEEVFNALMVLFDKGIQPADYDVLFDTRIILED